MDTPEIDYPKLAKDLLAKFDEHVEDGNVLLIVDRNLFKKFGGKVPLRLRSEKTKNSCRLKDSVAFPGEWLNLGTDDLHRGETEAWEAIHEAYDEILLGVQVKVKPPLPEELHAKLDKLGPNEIPLCQFDLMVLIGSLQTQTKKGYLGLIYPQTVLSALLEPPQETEPAPVRWRHREFT